MLKIFIANCKKCDTVIIGASFCKTKSVIPRAPALYFELGDRSEVKLKPPYIRLYIKDFAFDVQELTDEQLGKYMRAFIKAYKDEKIPKEKSNEMLFKELEKSFSQYSAVCERNRKNRTKTNSYKNDSSTTGQRLDDHRLTKNQEPITNNKNNLNKIVDIGKSKPVDNVDNSKGSFKKIGQLVEVGSFDIRNHLSDDDYLGLRVLIHPSWDRKKVFEKYNSWVKEKGLPEKPQKAFFGWCNKNHKWLKKQQ